MIIVLWAYLLFGAWFSSKAVKEQWQEMVINHKLGVSFTATMLHLAYIAVCFVIIAAIWPVPLWYFGRKDDDQAEGTVEAEVDPDDDSFHEDFNDLVEPVEEVHF